MTVAELIEQLKDVDGSREVEAECAQCGYCTTLYDIEPKGKRFPNVTILK